MTANASGRRQQPPTSRGNLDRGPLRFPLREEQVSRSLNSSLRWTTTERLGIGRGAARMSLSQHSRRDRVLLLRDPGADERPIETCESVAVDELEQRVCRQRRDDRFAWPSDSAVIEVAASLGTVDAYARRDRAC
jgi:hypothetical protein